MQIIFHFLIMATNLQNLDRGTQPLCFQSWIVAGTVGDIVAVVGPAAELAAAPKIKKIIVKLKIKTAVCCLHFGTSVSE